LGRRIGLGDVSALDRVDPKTEKASKSFESREETYVGLLEGNKTRKVKNGIARKMMRLELVKIEELAKEIGGRKAEAALKVSKEDDILSGLGRGFHLVARKPADHLFRYPTGAVQPVDLWLRHIRTFLGSPGDRRQVHPGTLA
jgi:hypothetical protein